MSALFPLFLKLEGRRVLLVGGGPVAEGKLGALLEAGARVTVVAPEVRPGILRPGVQVHNREFQPQDLDGVWLVVAAATAAVNAEVARLAREHRIFVNAVDDQAAASAYTGGVLRRGGVTVAFSTDGEAPALAGLLREGVDELLPRDLDRWIETAREARPSWRAADVPPPERRPRPPACWPRSVW